jgi:class 3 adenylate cyclase
VPRPGDDREPCARYRIVNLVRDGQWRQRIGITPDQQSGDPMFGSRSRVSACAKAVAISRKPPGCKADMMLANSGRTSSVADSLNILGRYFCTNSLGGSKASRRQAAKRSSGIGSGSEPCQPAYVSARTSDHTRAELVELAGADHFFWAGDPEPLLQEIEEFVTGHRTAADPERVLATVLFTDIVGSTQTASALGDQAWRDLLLRHNSVIRQELERWRGKEVKTAGDGFLATFDGPARAIRCAKAISEAVQRLGIEVRCGLHTGEIEIVDTDVAGLAVHIGARIAALAAPREVLVSRTVKDLVAGAGFQFLTRGVHSLKGVPEKWEIYALA